MEDSRGGYFPVKKVGVFIWLSLVLVGVLILVSFILIFIPYNRVSYHENVHAVSGLETGGIEWPSEQFSYYRLESGRIVFYLLQYRSNSFFEMNRDSVGSIKKEVRVSPSDSVDFTEPFHGSSVMPPFNFNLDYTYYRLADATPGVEGLFNESEGLFIVRFIVPRGKSL